MELDKILALENRTELVKLVSLCKEDFLACMVSIDGVEIGLCNKLNMIPVLEYEIAEIDKYLNGLENEYQ